MLEEKVFHSKDGQDLDYYYRAAPLSGRQPLVIYIHGAGSRGSSLSKMGRHGPIGQLDCGRDIPATVVTPQCHSDTWFDLYHVLLEFIDEMRHPENVDMNRVYLCGSSMGAYTSWQVAMSHPEWFAALVPVCGGGMYWNAARLKDLPIWAFHGALDATVLPEETLHMVAAVNRNGGNAKITIFPDVKHDAWVRAFGDDKMWEWMFSQEREKIK